VSSPANQPGCLFFSRGGGFFPRNR
jgi:hypothetical protein